MKHYLFFLKFNIYVGAIFALICTFNVLLLLIIYTIYFNYYNFTLYYKKNRASKDTLDFLKNEFETKSKLFYLEKYKITLKFTRGTKSARFQHFHGY